MTDLVKNVFVYLTNQAGKHKDAWEIIQKLKDDLKCGYWFRNSTNSN